METQDPVIFPIHLDGDRIAKLQLPGGRLSKQDADKIVRVILALADDEKPTS